MVRENLLTLKNDRHRFSYFFRLKPEDKPEFLFFLKKLNRNSRIPFRLEEKETKTNWLGLVTIVLT